MNEVEITISGLEELSKDLERLVSKYPDRAGDLLRTSAMEFRKKYVHKVRADAKTPSEKKKKKAKALTKLGTTKVYPIRGTGNSQAIDIGSTAPHFHLYERGHHSLVPRKVGRPSILTGKQKVKMVENGRVAGRFKMKETIEEYNRDLPKIAENMIEELLKEGGF